ncbi:hypothetical protein LTR66_010451 [Elasticomyces elasticus]|nr:hypothetical protein LTR66_010451 [Elasticomyces elasticus]
MSQEPMPPRIDVHSHYLPPFYRKALQEKGHGNPDGMPAIPEWSPEVHLALMSRIGISRSILSISTPGVHLDYSDPRHAVQLARQCNAYAAKLKHDHPEKFGFWAALPLPNIEGALDEISQALEEGADGFCLMTNYHGHYLGDKTFDSVFKALNERKATIFIHPTTPCMACSPDDIANGVPPIKAAPFSGRYPNPMLEFFFDTARVVANLFLSGTVSRYRDITIILPHLGGASTPLLSRFAGFSTLVPGPWIGVGEDELRELLNKRFYFDLAGFPFPSQIVGLVKGAGVGPDRLLYGSDFPYAKADGVAMLADTMDQGVKEMFSEEEVKNIYGENARRLLERTT